MHIATKHNFWIPNSYIWDETHCKDYTDYVLPVRVGDKLSLEKETSKGYIVKKDGIVGWYYGAVSYTHLYGLSLIWKEAEYNFPFWKRLKGLDWDKAYREALPKVTAASDMREYYLELSRFISLLRDGHTDLQFPHEVIQDAGQLRCV